MRAVAIVDGEGGPTLELIDTPQPVPGADDLLVKVHAAGINRADLRRTQAHFASSGPLIAGLEVAGEVIGMGRNVCGYALGDRVAALTHSGYAEFAIVNSGQALPVPPIMNWNAAAALPVWWMTAHDALITAGKFVAGEVVLIQAGASGIGIATAQIAKLLGASKIFATTRGQRHHDALLHLGVNHLIDREKNNVAQTVSDWTDGHGADVIIDMIGGGILAENIDTAALGGRIVSVGRMGGFTDTVDLDQLALKRIELIGVTFRTRSAEQKKKVRAAMLRDLNSALSDGRLCPIVDRTFALSAALDAQEYVRGNQHFGKVVLDLDAGI